MFKTVLKLTAAGVIALSLAACQSTVGQISPYVQAGNTAGAIVAGIINPALAIPAGAAAGALNAGWASVTPPTKKP